MQDRSTTRRTLRHSRRIACDGYVREDGLFDIEARLTDTRGYEMETMSGRKLLPGDPLHEMGLCITVDAELNIIDAHAQTSFGPTAECPAIAPTYDQLKGLRIGPGFSNTIKRLFRGHLGCTHLTELLGSVATTACQTVWSMTPISTADSGSKAPALLQSCHAFRSDGDAVRRYWPLHYTGG